MGQDRDREGPPLEIYGPEGLRTWLRICIRYSVSRIVPPYRVHELMDIPMAPEWNQGRMKNGRYFYRCDTRSMGSKDEVWGVKGLAGEDPISWISRAPMINLEPSSQFGEVEGGRDIYPRYDHPKCVDGAPIWEVEDEGDVKVYAAPMSHGVSFGNKLPYVMFSQMIFSCNY
jgi:ribonuclease Z